MKRIARWIVVALSGLITPVAHGEFETPIAIVNARIVPAPGQLIERGTILIEKGRITAVGTDVQLPPQVERISADGLTVYPGFIDATTNAGITAQEPAPDERARVEDEDPDVRDGPQSATVQAYRRLMHPHWRTEDNYSTKAAKLDDARKAGFTAALVAPPVAIFSGRSAVIQLGDRPVRRSILRTGFAQHAAFVTSSGIERRRRGFEFGSEGYPTTTMGAMAAFRQIMLDSRWQADLQAWATRNAGRERPPFDRDLEALRELEGGKTPVVFFANSENEIHRALDMAAEFKLRPIIAGGREAWRLVDRLKREDVPVLLSLRWSDEPKKPDASNAKSEGKGKGRAATTQSTTRPAPDLEPAFDEEWESQTWEPQRLADERQRLWGEEVDNARRLQEAGVRFAIASFEMKAPADVLKNIRKAVERGLPEDAAIAALTTRAAELLGVADSLGTIAAGKLANLTVMTEPLAKEKSKVRWVFVEGRRYDADRPGKRDDERGKGDKKDDKPDVASARGTTSGPTSSASASTSPATTSTTSTAPADAPTFRVEIEADRKPRLHTGGNVLLKNATLLTITGGDLAESDLLIRDGKIAMIGHGLTAPAGVTAIDLRGYFVMPGIFDAHSHMCSDGGLNEGSLSVTPEVRVGDVLDHRDLAAYRALAGGVTAIHTMHGSANTIGGQCAVIRLKYGRPVVEWRFNESARTVKFALGENVKQSNFGRRGSRFPNSRAGVEAVMRRSFDAARQYVAEHKQFDADKAAGRDPRPLRRDLRLEALADVLNGDLWVNCHCYRADEILRLFDVAEGYGFRVATLQHVLEGYRVIPEMSRLGISGSTFSDWWGYKLEAYDATPYNAARMVQGGVVTTINSDSPELVRHLNLETAKSLHFGGLGANDALRMITLNAAMQFGVDRYVGSLEVGKRGDVAVFDGHPLDTFAKCVLTLIDGEAYFQHDTFEPARLSAPRPARVFTAPREPLMIPASGSGRYVIRGATVHPISGPPISNGELVIEDGKIASIGPAGSAGSPSNAVVVDAAGLHVYPGLINAGTSLGLTEIDSVPGGVDVSDIGRFQPDLRAVSAYNPFAAAVRVARAEGVTTALVMAAGGPIAGQAGIVHLDGWSMPEAAVEQETALCVSVPSLPPALALERLDEERRQQIKKDTRTQLDELEEFMRLSQRYAVAMRGRPAGVMDVAMSGPANEFDRRLDSMRPYVEGSRPILIRAESYKEIREAIRFAERYKLRMIVFGGRDAWKVAAELASKQIDVIFNRPMAYPGGEFESWDSAYRNAAMLEAAGVRFCFATGGATLVKQLGVEAGMAVAHGLSEERGLRAITLDAAAILGVADRLGSLERGKVADIVISTDSPMQASNCVVATFIGGRPVDLANKHSTLDATWQTRPAPKLGPAPVLRGPPPLRLPRR